MVNPPPIIPGVPSIATGPSGVASQQNPPLLPHLPPGTVVLGTVAGQDAKGNPVIQTDALQLVLSTRFPLDKGAQIGIRIDPPVTRDAMPTFLILSVDGKPPAQQAPAALPPALSPTDAAPRPNMIQGHNPQAELAKPIGLLLEVMARPNSGQRQSVTPSQAEPAVPHAPARGVAAEVALSEGRKAAAVLLRPALSVKATSLLTQLATQTKTPLPVPAAALRPGLQLQVQVVQAPSASVSVPQNPPPAISPQPAPVVPNPAPTTAATPAPAQIPNVELPVYTSLPPQFRAGYAQYAKQSPAMMTGAPSSQPSAPPVSQGPAPPSPMAPPSPVASSASPSTPVNVASGLTPRVVEQLLARAEAQPLPQGQMAAVVMGKEPGGAIIAQTRLGMFTLPQVQAGAQAQLQAGTVLTWQVNALQVPQAGENLPPISGSGGLVATASRLTSEWSALEELSSLLHGMQSSMAAQTLQRIVPHAGSHLSAGLLFFMSVLRRGDVSEWLGRDMVGHLERMGKGDLVQRLGNDMSALRSLFSDQPQGGWQALFFPVMIDKQLQHAQMFIKPEEGQNRKDGGGGTRFIVELELSNLGPMQMDGLVKKRAEQTRFDLVIRTMMELPERMKTDIYAIFDNAQQATGLKGGITFRLVQEFPVNPLQEMQKNDEDGLGGIIA